MTKNKADTQGNNIIKTTTEFYLQTLLIGQPKNLFQTVRSIHCMCAWSVFWEIRTKTTLNKFWSTASQPTLNSSQYSKEITLIGK